MKKNFVSINIAGTGSNSPRKESVAPRLSGFFAAAPALI
jgi:hypothetical protein